MKPIDFIMETKRCWDSYVNDVWDTYKNKDCFVFATERIVKGYKKYTRVVVIDEDLTPICFLSEEIIWCSRDRKNIRKNKYEKWLFKDKEKMRLLNQILIAEDL